MNRSALVLSLFALLITIAVLEDFGNAAAAVADANSTLPPHLGNMTNLAEMSLSSNSLSGSLPPECAAHPFTIPGPQPASALPYVAFAGWGAVCVAEKVGGRSLKALHSAPAAIAPPAAALPRAGRCSALALISR